MSYAAPGSRAKARSIQIFPASFRLSRSSRTDHAPSSASSWVRSIDHSMGGSSRSVPSLATPLSPVSKEVSKVTRPSGPVMESSAQAASAAIPRARGTKQIRIGERIARRARERGTRSDGLARVGQRDQQSEEGASQEDRAQERKVQVVTDERRHGDRRPEQEAEEGDPGT